MYKRQAYSLIDTVIEHKDIIKSMDIVEYNPLKDENDDVSYTHLDVYKRQNKSSYIYL